ncbi:3-methyladenine DNA glycosylase [Microbacterium sp. YY-01]|uniref:3-methyladenine DNA glycosylase n=1 Tax=Microbacterium sp. YY-01 TaxID=3421634 RepID=UPI003D164495
MHHTVLDRDEWQTRAHAHRVRVDELTAAHRERAVRGEKHPVWDFLFTYYSYKPSLLRRWHPGAGVVLLDAPERAEWRWYAAGPNPDSVVPDAAAFTADMPRLASLVDHMLRRVPQQAARFDCFGLHEWAMVYQADERRHEVALRLGQNGTDEVVESHRLRCTHFDAFRFFTAPARPRNEQPLRRDDQVRFEQPGCLHAGMDVYRWAVKLGPLVPGDLLLDAFELARDIRLLDMKASPYDLSAWNIAPVRIETPEGKAEYVEAQRVFAERSNTLRRMLLHAWTATPHATRPPAATEKHRQHPPVTAA